MVATKSEKVFAPEGSRGAQFLLAFFFLWFGPVGILLRLHREEPSQLVFISGIVTSLVLTFFGCAAMRRALRWPKTAIVLDHEGLWPKHQERDRALIPWKNIAATEEHFYLQETRLLDDHGKTLISLDYRLDPPGILRESLAERMRQRHSLASLPLHFSIAAGHLPGMAGLVLFCFAAAWHLYDVPRTGSLMAWGLVAAGIWLTFITLRTVTKIELSQDRLTVHQPFRKRSWTNSELEYVDVEVNFSIGFGSCRAVLGLRDAGAKNVYFPSLPPTEMKQLLESWRKLSNPTSAIRRPAGRLSPLRLG